VVAAACVVGEEIDIILQKKTARRRIMTAQMSILPTWKKDLPTLRAGIEGGGGRDGQGRTGQDNNNNKFHRA